MAITQAIANAFKKQLLEGDANFKSSGGDNFKLALFTSSATLNSTTTAYSASNEVSNTGTYSAGGGALTGQSTNIGTGTGKGVAFVDFAAVSYTHLTLPTKRIV